MAVTFKDVAKKNFDPESKAPTPGFQKAKVILQHHSEIINFLERGLA